VTVAATALQVAARSVAESWGGLTSSPALYAGGAAVADHAPPLPRLP